MKTAPNDTLSIQVDLPKEAFRHHPWAPEEISKRLRALWLVELVRERRISYGKAAQLANMPKAAFMKLMGQHQVSTIDLDPDDLQAEFDSAKELSA